MKAGHLLNGSDSGCERAPRLRPDSLESQQSSEASQHLGQSFAFLLELLLHSGSVGCSGAKMEVKEGGGERDSQRARAVVDDDAQAPCWSCRALLQRDLGGKGGADHLHFRLEWVTSLQCGQEKRDVGPGIACNNFREIFHFRCHPTLLNRGGEGWGDYCHRNIRL